MRASYRRLSLLFLAEASATTFSDVENLFYLELFPLTGGYGQEAGDVFKNALEDFAETFSDIWESTIASVPGDSVTSISQVSFEVPTGQDSHPLPGQSPTTDGSFVQSLSYSISSIDADIKDGVLDQAAYNEAAFADNMFLQFLRSRDPTGLFSSVTKVQFLETFTSDFVLETLDFKTQSLYLELSPVEEHVSLQSAETIVKALDIFMEDKIVETTTEEIAMVVPTAIVFGFVTNEAFAKYFYYSFDVSTGTVYPQYLKENPPSAVTSWKYSFSIIWWRPESFEEGVGDLNSHVRKAFTNNAFTEYMVTEFAGSDAFQNLTTTGALAEFSEAPSTQPSHTPSSKPTSAPSQSPSLSSHPSMLPTATITDAPVTSALSQSPVVSTNAPTPTSDGSGIPSSGAPARVTGYYLVVVESFMCAVMMFSFA